MNKEIKEENLERREDGTFPIHYFKMYPNQKIDHIQEMLHNTYIIEKAEKNYDLINREKNFKLEDIHKLK